MKIYEFKRKVPFVSSVHSNHTFILAWREYQKYITTSKANFSAWKNKNNNNNSIGIPTHKNIRVIITRNYYNLLSSNI